MSGFKKFLLRGNLVDLAVAVVIGVAFNAVIQALIADLITPIISAIAGKPSFSSLSFTINHSKFALHQRAAELRDHRRGRLLLRGGARHQGA
jgi:large conductance mechanosensitive channel